MDAEPLSREQYDRLRRHLSGRLLDEVASEVESIAAKVRRETAERIAQAIRARRREFRRLNADEQYLLALDDAYGLARIAREEASRG